MTATSNIPIAVLGSYTNNQLSINIKSPLVTERAYSTIALDAATATNPNCSYPGAYWTKRFNGCNDEFSAVMNWTDITDCGWTFDSSDVEYFTYDTNMIIQHHDLIDPFAGRTGQSPVERLTQHVVPLQVQFQKSIEVSTNVTVQSPVRLLVAVSRQEVASNAQSAVIEVTTNLVFPYKLTAGQLIATPSLEHPGMIFSIVEVGNPSLCPNTPGSFCTQVFRISINIGTSCTISGAYGIGWNLTCQNDPATGGRSSACAIDGIVNASANISIVSEDFCAKVSVKVVITGGLGSFDPNPEITPAALEAALGFPVDEAAINEYYACLDIGLYQSQVLDKLQQYISTINSIGTALGQFSSVVGLLEASGVPALFNARMVPDPATPLGYITRIDPGGLNIPASAYNTTPGANPAPLEYMWGFLNLVFDNIGLVADFYFDDAVRMEMEISRFSTDSEPTTVVNMTYLQLVELAPNFQWSLYFQANSRLDIAPNFSTNILVGNPSFFSNLSAILPSLANRWQSYLKARVLKKLSPSLPPAYSNPYLFYFKTLIDGWTSPGIPPRTTFCAQNTRLGALLGNFYLPSAFPKTQFIAGQKSCFGAKVQSPDATLTSTKVANVKLVNGEEQIVIFSNGVSALPDAEFQLDQSGPDFAAFLFTLKDSYITGLGGDASKQYSVVSGLDVTFKGVPGVKRMVLQGELNRKPVTLSARIGVSSNIVTQGVPKLDNASSSLAPLLLALAVSFAAIFLFSM